MPQLSPAELVKVEDMRRAGKTGLVILRALQKARAKQSKAGPGKSAVYDFLAGKTHKQHLPETRGRKKAVTAKVLDVLDKHRKKLQKDVNSEWHVTWDDVLESAAKELRQKKLWGKRQKLFTASSAAKEMRDKRNVKKRASRKHLARS